MARLNNQIGIITADVPCEVKNYGGHEYAFGPLRGLYGLIVVQIRSRGHKNAASAGFPHEDWEMPTVATMNLDR